MKKAIWFVAGLLVSVLTVLPIGLFSVQRQGLRGGGVLDIDNQLIAVTEPNSGPVQMLATAAVGTLALALLTLAVRNRSTGTRVAFRSGFVVATLAQLAVCAVLLLQDTVATRLGQTPPLWAEGWIREGGTNPAVHLILIIAIYLLCSELRGRSTTRTSGRAVGERENAT